MLVQVHGTYTFLILGRLELPDFRPHLCELLILLCELQLQEGLALRRVLLESPILKVGSTMGS